MMGVLRCTVTDVFKWSGENHEQEYGISVIVPIPSLTPRLNPPTFGGESRTSGIYVKVTTFKRKLPMLHERSNNKDTDINALDRLMQEQNKAFRNMDTERFANLSSILADKVSNPRKIKFEVERFLHLKVVAKKQKDGTLEWEWSTQYGVNDLCDDPKTTNTYYGEVTKIEQDQFKRGFKPDDNLDERDFQAQFKPSIKAVRQNRGACMGNMSTLCSVDTQNELEDADNILILKDTFPEPEWFAEEIATCPELAMHKLDKHYGELYRAKTENDEFDIGYVTAGAKIIVQAVDFMAVGNHEKAVKVIVNCNCGRLEAHCHGQWIMNKMVAIARGLKSNELKAKGL